MTRNTDLPPIFKENTKSGNIANYFYCIWTWAVRHGLESAPFVVVPLTSPPQIMGHLIPGVTLLSGSRSNPLEKSTMNRERQGTLRLPLNTPALCLPCSLVTVRTTISCSGSKCCSAPSAHLALTPLLIIWGDQRTFLRPSTLVCSHGPKWGCKDPKIQQVLGRCK